MVFCDIFLDPRSNTSMDILFYALSHDGVPDRQHCLQPLSKRLTEQLGISELLSPWFLFFSFLLSFRQIGRAHV